jgi:hypothetical protein
MTAASLIQTGNLPVKLIKVSATDTAFRPSGGGAYVEVPALIDGNKKTLAITFYSLSYRDMTITFAEPIDFLEMTAHNVDSSMGIVVQYNGVELTADARPLFPTLLTYRWPVTRKAGIARVGAGGSHSTFRFYEICGWRKPD